MGAGRPPQLFRRKRSKGPPFLGFRPLLTSALISGWKFACADIRSLMRSKFVHRLTSSLQVTIRSHSSSLSTGGDQGTIPPRRSAPAHRGQPQAIAGKRPHLDSIWPAAVHRSAPEPSLLSSSFAFATTESVPRWRSFYYRPLNPKRSEMIQNNSKPSKTEQLSRCRVAIR